MMPGLVVEEGEVHERDRHIGPLALDALGGGNRGGEVAALILRHHVFDRAIDRDEPLRIVGVRETCLRHRGGAGIPETAKPLANVGCFGHARGCALVGAQALQNALQFVDVARTRRRQVVLLAGVGSQVVELGNRKIDVLHRPANDTVQRRPSSIERRRKRFEVRGHSDCTLAVRFVEETAAIERGRNHRSQRIEDGRQDVDVAHRIGDDAWREDLRREEDERHVQRALVGEQAMRRFAVLAARLSVIAGHDDERAAGRAVAKNRIEKRREGGVGGGDFAEVRIRRESRPERFGRRIRKVRLVEMDPGEPWSADWLLVAGC